MRKHHATGFPEQAPCNGENEGNKEQNGVF